MAFSSYTNYAYGMLTLLCVGVSGLANRRLNLDFYRLLTSTIMFSWSGVDFHETSLI